MPVKPDDYPNYREEIIKVLGLDLLSKKMRLIKEENAGLKTQLERKKNEIAGK